MALISALLFSTCTFTLVHTNKYICIQHGASTSNSHEQWTRTWLRDRTKNIATTTTERSKCDLEWIGIRLFNRRLIARQHIDTSNIFHRAHLAVNLDASQNYTVTSNWWNIDKVIIEVNCHRGDECRRVIFPVVSTTKLAKCWQK